MRFLLLISGAKLAFIAHSGKPSMPPVAGGGTKWIL
jgi:hypothetical protein